MLNETILDSNWVRLPKFALIRGPFGRTGYQVATIARDGDPDHQVLLLFSGRESAERHAARRPRGFDDWKPGPLPSWKRLAVFLRSMETTARHVCLDFDGSARGTEIAVPVEVLLTEIESRLGSDSSSGEGCEAV